MNTDDRLRRIVELKNNNHTLQQIADEFDLTRQRVSQLLKQANYHCHPIPTNPRRTPEQAELRRLNAIETSRRWYANNKERKAQSQRDYRQRQYVAELSNLVASNRCQP